MIFPPLVSIIVAEPTIPERASDRLERYRLPGSSVFMVGTFDRGVTVLSQQVRALNLVWALIESGALSLDQTDSNDDGQDTSRKHIAILGAGFAGLTIAAGLLKKRVNADITLFERRDTVLPLQHGSDTRWLHPHIYDWPREGSESYSAALPVLNWTASRASDVVVQVLKEWAQVASVKQPPPDNTTTSEPPEIRIFCNTKHIQVSAAEGERAITVEWIGDERDSCDPAIPAEDRFSPIGDSQPFDIVVLALGFGLETGARTVYWRNETLAQPALGQARSTYIVSGAGDGGMIDLFRLRISHFRQDRILAELFSGSRDLLERLRLIHNLASNDPASNGVSFEQLREVWEDQTLGDSASKVLDRLRKRLRHDTTVLLRVRNPSFAEVFAENRNSFQNRVLAYLLYRCGAFTPVTAAKDADLTRLAKEHGVPDDRIIIRHGTEIEAGLTDVLAGDLDDEFKECWSGDAAVKTNFQQDDYPEWRGGYFDMPGITDAEQNNPSRAKNQVRLTWRKEYLPSPTEAIAASFCSAIAGFVGAIQPSDRLRVTLHRTLISGDEVVLQQCCDYQGMGVAQGNQAGRTFPSRNGTVGAAFDLGAVVRTSAGATKSALKADMEALSLYIAAQNMREDVASVAAIPLVGADGSVSGHAGNVIGVLYLDSYGEKAFVDDDMMEKVIRMCDSFLASLPRMKETSAGRIANTEFWHRGKLRDDRPHAIDPRNWGALERLEDARMRVPRTDSVRHLNFDYSDFTPVEQT